MTTPQQQPPPAQQPPQDQQLALAAAEALAVAGTVAEALTIMGVALAALKLRQAAARAMLEIVMGHPPDAAGFYGPATTQVARLNLVRRAQFLVASIKRTNADFASGDPQRILDARERERHYYEQHMLANWSRERAAAQVDSASMEWGRLLGWYAVIDRRTEIECRLANRHNFYADKMPSIGYPGMVHLHCRCQPGPPFPGARIMTPARVPFRGWPVPDNRPQHHPANAGAGR